MILRISKIKVFKTLSWDEDGGGEGNINQRKVSLKVAYPHIYVTTYYPSQANLFHNIDQSNTLVGHSGYHPRTTVTEVKHRPLRIVLGWGTKMVE